MAEADHLPSIRPPGPYPHMPFIVRMGGHVPNGLTGYEVDRFTVPFDCYLRQARLNYHKTGSAHLDAIALTTVDKPQALFPTIANPSADVDDAIQAFATGAAGYQINRGDVITLSADSTDANEAGNVQVTLLLDPVYAPSAQLGSN